MQDVKTPKFGEIWHLDFVGPLTAAAAPTQSLACEYLLVGVEYVSGYCVAIPQVVQNSEVVLKYLRDLLMYFPKPKTVVSDNGGPFSSAATKDAALLLDLKWRYTSVYYPHANSKVERVNGLIKKILKSLNPSMTAWPLFIMKAVNCPSELVFGYSQHFDIREEIFIKNNILPNLSSLDSDVITADAVYFRKEERKLIEANREDNYNKKAYARKMFKLLNEPKYNGNSYVAGEFVLKKNFKKAKKTDPSYEGPFVIAEALPKNSYKLIDLHGREVKNTFNLQHLRPCYQHYGSPLRSISDFSKNFGDDERELFQSTFKD